MAPCPIKNKFPSPQPDIPDRHFKVFIQPDFEISCSLPFPCFLHLHLLLFMASWPLLRNTLPVYWSRVDLRAVISIWNAVPLLFPCFSKPALGSDFHGLSPILTHLLTSTVPADHCSCFRHNCAGLIIVLIFFYRLVFARSVSFSRAGMVFDLL